MWKLKKDLTTLTLMKTITPKPKQLRVDAHVYKLSSNTV